MRADVARQPSRTRLGRSLGLLEITASGVGIIIGAGIYVLIGAAAAHAGATLWAAFLLAAVLSALSGLSYAELSSPTWSPTPSDLAARERCRPSP